MIATDIEDLEHFAPLGTTVHSFSRRRYPSSLGKRFVCSAQLLTVIILSLILACLMFSGSRPPLRCCPFTGAA